MSSDMSFSSIKLSQHIRDHDAKKSAERKRQLAYLVQQYLKNHGYFDTAKCFETESMLNNQFRVCDNIDLSNILQEYESYYFLRFQKSPNIIKKNEIVDSEVKATQASKKKNIIKKGSSGSGNKCNANSVSNKTSPRNSNEIRNAAGFDITVLPLSENPTSYGDATYSDMNTFHPDNLQADRMLKPLSGCPSLTDEWKEFAEIISNDICHKNLNVHWNDIAGLDDAKALIQEAVIYPMKYPELFTDIITPWKGLLLYGPPGTGKTMLAKALATECNTTFFNISASTVVSKWRGDSEKLIRAMFDLARYHAPSTIFLDEVDALAPRRDQTRDHQAAKRLTAELLGQMDGLANLPDKVFLLAASNLPWEIDPAMLRRLEKRILVDLPNLETRKHLFQLYLPAVVNSKLNIVSAVDYGSLSEMTGGYSSSEIRLVCKEATMQITRHVISLLESPDSNKRHNKIEVNPVTTENVAEAVRKTRPSTLHMAPKYYQWKEKFGAE